MKNSVQKGFGDQPQTQWHRRTLLACVFTGLALALLSLVPVARAANGTPDYMDLNGATVGFGTPSGIIPEAGTSASYWDTSSSGTGTPAAFVTKDQMTFTNAATDATGGICAINLNGNDDINGFVDNCTNSIIQLGGTAAADSNDHFANSGITVSVCAGSTLIWADTRNSGTATVGGGGSGGFNMNAESVTFTGSGTNTFNTYMGNNDSALLTLNGPTLNLDYTTPVAYMKGGVYSGGFTLTSGNLNFGTANSLDAFSQFITGKLISINGGTIDNISGSPIKLVTTNALAYSIGGSFTFNGSSSLDFGAGGVTNAANNTITINANTLAIGGIISGSGNSLTLAGPGTLLLYGASTFSGNTIVNAGTLALTNNGSLSSSPLTVNNATFDVSGLSASTTLTSLAIANSTLVVSGLSTTTTNMLVATLSPGGTANTINVASLPLTTMAYPLVFPLIQATTVNGTLNFTLGTLPAGQGFSGYVTNIPASGLVELVLTAGPAPVQVLTWTGINANNSTPDGTWDVGSTPDWLGNGTASTFEQSALVTFNDTALGLTTVNLAQQLTPSSLTVSNNTLSYTFTGGSLSDGATSLTLNKKGSGNLILQEGGDNFSGGINVSGGKVVVDNNSSGITGGATIGAGATLQLGNNDAGAVLPSGVITANGALNFDCDDALTTVASTISGSGSINQVNTNTVLLSDSGTSSGNWTATIANGTLQAVDNTALGTVPGGAVTITNGGTFDLGGNTTANNADFANKLFNIAGAGVGGNGAIVNSYNDTQEDAFQNIALTANATIGGPYRWDMRNGTPKLNLAGYTLTVTNVNLIALVGVNVTAGNIIIQQSSLAFELACTVTGTGTITVNSGSSMGLYESSLGSITRSVVLNGGGITNISGANETAYVDAPILFEADSGLGTTPATTTIYDGVISDGGNGFSLNNAGTGTNILTATNTYSGNTYDTQGTLGLSGHGSISTSPQIIVNNGSLFDISGLTIPFSGANTLLVGDDTLGVGMFNLGSTVVSGLNSLSLSNAVLNMAVVNPSVANITVTNLNLGDGGAASTINITALPALEPAQFPLIKYTSVTGTYNLNLGTVPTGYTAHLVNNTANNSIDLAITAFPAGIWTGGGSPNNDWSDAANWSGTSLTGTDPLVFTGTVGLNNTNDTGETASSINFVAGAGAFTLNGNPVTLEGNLINASSSRQTVNVGLDLSLTGTNLLFNAGTAGLVVNGGITNVSSGLYTLSLQGTNGVLAGPLQSSSPGSLYNLGINLNAVAGASNTWSIVGNNTSYLTNLTIIGSGSVNFGTGADAPSLTVSNANGFGAITVGATTNTASSFTMNSGVLDLTNEANSPIDLGTVGATGTFNMNGGTLSLNGKYLMIGDAGSSGIFNQYGGTVIATIANDVILGNSISNSTGVANLISGTFDATANNDFYLGFRGNGTWNISSNALLELQTMNVTRNSSDSAGASGTLNLNGGTVIMNGESMGNAATGQTGAIHFNGGVMQASASSTNFISPAPLPSVLTTTVKTGGAILNDGGFDITIATALIHDTNSASDGGLVKLGSGILTLSGANTYNGPTTVSNGTLLVSGSLGTNAVNVVANATLAGTGTVGGNVTVNGTIAPGTTATSGLLTGSANVTFNAPGTSLMKLDINNATNDMLSAAGTLTYGGTLNVTVLSGTPALNASYKLFTAASLTGTFTATNLPALASGLAWNWSPANGTLTVIQTQGVNTNPATADFQGLNVNGTLQFTWAPDHLGWQLYTNSVGLTATGSWFPVAGSSSVTNETITINPAVPNVFFQLRYP